MLAGDAGKNTPLKTYMHVCYHGDCMWTYAMVVGLLLTLIMVSSDLAVHGLIRCSGFESASS